MRHASRVIFPVLFALGGCYSTDTIVLDYPPTEEQTRAFNEFSGEESLITLDDGTIAAGTNPSLDSLVVQSGPFWDRQGVPLARVQSITVVDTRTMWWRGPLTVAAVTTGIAAVAPIQGGSVGEAALVGGLLGLTYLNGVTALFTAPRRTFVLALPPDDSAAARRRNDILALDPRIEQESRFSSNELPRVRIRFGAGAAWANAVCSECGEKDAQVGSIVSGSVGLQVTERILFDLSLYSWTHTGTTRYQFMLESALYPGRESGFYFSFGIGEGIYRSDDTYTGSVKTRFTVSPVSVSGSGLALSAGIGYDIRFSKSFLLNTSVVYSHTFLGSLQLNDQVEIERGRSSRMLRLDFSLLFAPRGE